MRFAGHLASFAAGIAVAIVMFAAIRQSTSAPESVALVAGAAVTPSPVPSPTATPLPATWIDGLDVPRGPSPPISLSCLDSNGDGHLNADDGSWFFSSIDVPLIPEAACGGSGHGADFYE